MNIMLVDDNKENRESIKNFLEHLGHQVIEAENGRQVLQEINKHDIQLLLSDIKMPEMSGIELLRNLRNEDYRFKIVLFTAFGDVDTVVEALRLRAFDFLQKPVSADELVSIIDRVAKDATTINYPTITLPVKNNVLVYSDKMRNIFKIALKYHNTRDIPVLIEGETGTGKEVLARIIHNGNRKNNTPFVDINCAAISPNLFESELFGYEPGAFTGGSSRGQKGKFDLAIGGTIFLDEIGDIPLEQQAKLLRVLQEHEYYRVGGLTKIKMDSRIICATNNNLEKAIKEGKFRPDLYFRLKVGYIHLPPLRKRTEEILPLTNHFLKEFSTIANKECQNLSYEAEELLLSYSWPGNIRELRNMMEILAFMNDNTIITPDHLDRLLIFNEDDPYELNNDCLPSALRDATKKQVIQALNVNKGNKTEAARQLGISRRSLYRLLDKYQSNN
ncbi:MAG: sigma-54-dependent Fis family transcriptional regulator [Firmicutes bacterium HGW-Firmicutes-12]|jgi:DNA-binding NtrC family response regulator|nr:MAG: sigma-54-dependent Fis family transcriptional regulator [Firmicutes bacterium HGW-Firmicutes-12]